MGFFFKWCKNILESFIAHNILNLLRMLFYIIYHHIILIRTKISGLLLTSSELMVIHRALQTELIILFSYPETDRSCVVSHILTLLCLY